MYPGKMFIAWLKMLMMLLLHMVAININTNGDGKNVDREVVKGFL
jgi:hypothetical protein